MPLRVVGRLGLGLMAVGFWLFAGGMLAGRSKFVPFLGETGPFITLDAHLSPHTIVPIARSGALFSGIGLVAVLWALRRRWPGPSPRVLLIGGGVAAAVLTVLPPAGSIDILNYALYGRIADLGFDPYSMTPKQLRAAGDPVGLLGPGSWGDQPTVYGPVTTAVQTAAAWLGGASMGWIVFWLKVFHMLMFLGTAVILSRIAGAERGARVRAAVLWTANPLMLFWMVGSGHVDVLAVTLLIGSVCVIWFGARRALLGATRFDEALIVWAMVLSGILLPGIGTSRLQLDGVAVAAPSSLWCCWCWSPFRRGGSPGRMLPYPSGRSRRSAESGAVRSSYLARRSVHWRQTSGSV